MDQKKNITAFILSGGSSCRMGENKALLKINGKYQIQRLLELLNPIFDSIIISSNDIQQFKFTGRKVVRDIYSGQGPLSGIHAGLTKTETENNFFISCDMPFISTEMINYLINYKSNALIVLPKAEGKIQQLCGMYSKHILPKVEFLLLEAQKSKSTVKGSIFDLLGIVPNETVEVSKLKYYNKEIFFNMNTPSDYEYVKSKYSSN